MKKMFFFPALLMLILVVPAFAQDEEKSGWTVSGGVQAFADLMYFTKGKGSSTDTDVAVPPTPDQTWGDETKGSFNFLSSSRSRAPGLQADFTVANSKEGDNFSYALSLQLVFELKRGEGLLGGDKPTISGLLNSFGVGDWFAKGTAGIFEGYIGNTGFGGVVPAYGNFNDYINFKLENFYVNAVGNRLKTNKIDLWDGAAFALAVNFLDDKLRLALGTDFGAYIAPANGYSDPYASSSSVNMGAIFSLNNSADVLSLDVFYGINGRDDNKNQANGVGKWENRFGVYAGLNFIEWLGLSVGYSASTVANERTSYNVYDPLTGGEKIDPITLSTIYDSEYKTKNPLYSSIHIHMNMDIKDRFGITFNNNLSFAGKKGAGKKPGTIGYTVADLIANNTDDRIIGLSGDRLYENQKENWFGYDVGLALNFKATDNLNLCLQLTNQLGVRTDKDQGTDPNVIILLPSLVDTTNKTLGNIFFVGLNAEYNVGMVTFGAGLQLETITQKSTYEAGTYTSEDKSTEIRFGIPLFFKVAF